MWQLRVSVGFHEYKIVNRVELLLAGTLAVIDRNLQSFGRELFTDSGKYALRFGFRADQAAEQAANTIQA